MLLWCHVFVSHGGWLVLSTLHSSGKCKYAGGVSFDNYAPCPLTCGDVPVGESFIVNGKNYTRRGDFLGLTTEEEFELSCTTGISDFSNLFLGSTLNPEINTWDTSAAVTMDGMFAFATNFNQRLSCWDVNDKMNCTAFGADATTWISTYGSNLNGTNPPLSDQLIAAGCAIYTSTFSPVPPPSPTK